MGDLPDMTSHPHLLQSMYSGYIIGALRSAFSKFSADSFCTVHKSPKSKLIVQKAYPVSKFQLVALSGNVAVVCGKRVSESNKVLSVGEMYKVKTSGDDDVERSMVGVVRMQQTFPVTHIQKEDIARKEATPLLAAYWSVAETYDTSKANATRSSIKVTFKVGAAGLPRIGSAPDSDDVGIDVPTIVNTKPLNHGDEVLVLKLYASSDDDDSTSDEAPAPKRQRADPKPKGKAKGTSKGKSKGKAKDKTLRK